MRSGGASTQKRGSMLEVVHDQNKNINMIKQVLESLTAEE